MAPNKIKSLKSLIFYTCWALLVSCVYKGSRADAVFTFSQRKDLTHLQAGRPHFGELPFQAEQPDQVHVAVVVIDADRQLKGKETEVDI